MRLRQSRFVHALPVGDGITALYNAATTRVMYVTPGNGASSASTWPFNSLDDLPQEMIHALQQEAFIVPELSDEFSDFEQQCRTLVSEQPEITVLKLFMTTHCNMRCKYCLITKNLSAHDNVAQHSSVDVVSQAIDLFAWHARQSSKPEKNVFFYGGEPLMNWPSLKAAIERLRHKERAGDFNGTLELVLETNGTLLTPDKCRFLAETGTAIIVSLDGLPEVHDAMRPMLNGGPSYAAALRGFREATEAGCTAVVSTVASPAMLSKIETAIKHLAETVQAPSIGLDLLHLLQKPDGSHSEMTEDDLIAAYIRAFEVARDCGLYVEHIVRRIRPFVQETLRVKDCPACGNRMVVAPDGAIGMCEGFIGSREFFTGSVYDRPDLRNDPVIEAWNMVTPLLRRECYSCPGLAVCGGGCPYNSYVATGQFLGGDRKTCSTSKAFIHWLLRDLFNYIDREILTTRHFYLATRQEKERILGRVPLSLSLSLPLVKNLSSSAERRAHT